MRDQKKYTAEQVRLASYAKALSHPARVAIVEYLAGLDSCFFGEIHSVLPISKATVSQHLTELKDCGLIKGTLEAPKVRYCINRKNWNEAKKIFPAFFAGKILDESKNESC